MKLYENIRNRRVELGLTQSELASKVGYSDKGMISKIENGKVDLSQSQVMKFAKALETTPGELMGWTTEYHVLDGTDIIVPVEKPPHFIQHDSSSLIDIYKDIILIQQYKDLLRRPEIQTFLEAAKDCDEETVRFATGVMKLKKDGGL